MKVVRIRMFTAVFLADMTPRKPRIGCADPPIARSSETVEMIDRGVAHTMKPENQSVGDVDLEARIEAYICDVLKDRDLWASHD